MAIYIREETDISYEAQWGERSTVAEDHHCVRWSQHEGKEADPIDSQVQQRTLSLLQNSVLSEVYDN